MASLVNPFNINGNYPIAGQDNDSQGFRDNFTNIKNNFIFIKQEVEDLQSKAILKTALSGTSLDNNFLGSQVRNIQIKNISETVYDWGEVGAATATEIQLDFALGNIHKLNATGAIKINSVIKNWPAALQFSRMLFYIYIDAVTSTLELPSTLTTDLSSIPGLRTLSSSNLITFTDPGYYIFEFSSVDSGSTVFVRETTRGNPVFRDPNFYMAGIGSFETPTLRLGWGNLFAVSARIDSNSKAGTDTFSVRGGITSFQNFTDGGNDPDDMTQAGFSIAKSRTADPNSGGTTNPTESVINSGDYIGYFNALAYTQDPGGVSSGRAYHQLGLIGFYATGSNNSLGGNIVISTKRDGLGLSPAISIDNDQNVIVYGNLQVDGIQTIINSTTLSVDDVNIVVAAGNDIGIPAQANAAGIVVDGLWANIQYFTTAADGAINNRWNMNKPLTVSAATSSSSTTSGALVVTGGVGIGGNISVGGGFQLAGTDEATSTTTGAFSVAGGISAAKNMVAGGAVFANSTATSSNLSSGAFQVQGGASILGNLYVGGQSASGATQTGLFVISTSTSANTSSGAVVVKGGLGVAGPVYLSDASSANGVTVTSTLNVNGQAQTDSNASARTASAAFRVVGGSKFDGNVVFGVGSGTAGRVYIDNAQTVTLGDIKTGGLVLGNATTRVGMSVSGDINIGTDATGSVYILNKEDALGTETGTTLTPFVPSEIGGNPAIGALTALGGVNVFGDFYLGQPHDGSSYDGALVPKWASGTRGGAYDPVTNRPAGSWAGNLYITSGTNSTSFQTGAVVLKTVRLADESESQAGMGIAGNLFVNGGVWAGEIGSSVTGFGNLVAASSVESTLDATTTPNGSLVVLGGAGILKKLNVGGVISANSGVASTSTSSGAIIITGSGGLGVGGGITAGNLTLSAGTTSQEPLRFESGTLLTGAKAGAAEFVGGSFYVTPTTGARALIPAAHYYVVSGNASINNATTITSTAQYNMLGGTTVVGSVTGTVGAITATAATVYEVDIKVVLVATSSGGMNSVETRFTFGGTATYSWYNYDTEVSLALAGSDTVTPTPGAPVRTNFFGTTTMPTATTGTIAAASNINNRTIRIRGMIAVNTGGTIIPSVNFGANPNSIFVATGLSYYKFTPLGATSATNLSNTGTFGP